MLPKMQKDKLFQYLCRYFIFANSCQFSPMFAAMLPKMEIDKLFTIIYADILILANLCQFLPMPLPMLLKMEKAGCACH